METNGPIVQPIKNNTTDFLPLQGTDYVEFYALPYPKLQHNNLPEFLRILPPWLCKISN